MNVAEIAKFSAKWTADKFQKLVLKMDTSLWIEALNGFPGSFASYINKTIGCEGIMKLMKGVKNRKAKFILAVAFCNPEEKPIVETSELKGKITTKLEGKYGWFSDFFFIAKGYKKTMGYYPDEKRKRIWPKDCWKKIVQKNKAKKLNNYQQTLVSLK